MKKLLLIFVLLMAANGCETKSFEKKIGGDFYLKKIDLNGIQFIGKRYDTILNHGIFDIVVPDYVYAVGSNENVIIAKQHFSKSLCFGGFAIDSMKTQFYVIDLNKPNDNIYGPLWEYEFENKVLDINGEMIEFDLVYPEFKK